MYTHTHTHTHMHPHKNAHTHAHTHTHTHIHTHAHTRTFTHTHVHAHTCKQMLSFTNLSIWLLHPQNGDSCECHSLRIHSLAVSSPCPYSQHRPSRCYHCPDQTYNTVQQQPCGVCFQVIAHIVHPHVPNALIKPTTQFNKQQCNVSIA